MTARGWGPWSAIKLRTLGEYLMRFTQASQKSSEIVYLDLFAGRPSNYVRGTGKLLEGSALLALATNPPFTRLAFCELPANATRLEQELRAQHPHRRFEIYSGDSNETIQQVLADLTEVRWAPTFAFVDPDGPHCHWTTLEALARHKPSTAKSKVELWILFPTLFMRQLPLHDPAGPRPQDMDQIDQMFGNDQWELIYRARRAGDLKGIEARTEYVNLFRWRLQHVLGYHATHPIDIPNEQGRPIYTMIFATDHPAGDRIMRSLYKKAAADFPQMRLQAAERKAKQRREDDGILSLFDDDPIPMVPEDLPVGEYIHEDPWPPLGDADI